MYALLRRGAAVFKHCESDGGFYINGIHPVEFVLKSEGIDGLDRLYGFRSKLKHGIFGKMVEKLSTEVVKC